jgi:hypothetical protein
MCTVQMLGTSEIASEIARLNGPGAADPARVISVIRHCHQASPNVPLPIPRVCISCLDVPAD